MSSNYKVKVAIQVAVTLSAAGVATILHNAPASADSFPLTLAIATPISSATTTPLSFGKVIPSSQNGVVTINADGSISSSGGARYIPNSGADNATLSFTGGVGQAIQIDKPSTVILTNGTDEMNLTLKYDAIPTVIPTGGNVVVNYGGDLTVAANQAPGVYTGTYNIFVNYV